MHTMLARAAHAKGRRDEPDEDEELADRDALVIYSSVDGASIDVTFGSLPPRLCPARDLFAVDYTGRHILCSHDPPNP